MGLPGHIVERGVYKGASFLRFATFREILENPHARKAVGFDTFGRFPEGGAGTIDRDYIRSFSAEGGNGISAIALPCANALKLPRRQHH